MVNIHVSIDDVSNIFIDILDKNCSLQNSNAIKWMKRMHSKYNCCISLYMQNWAFLEKFSHGTLSELQQYSDWLRVGIHTTKDGRDFGKLNYEEGKKEWEEFVSCIIHLVGNGSVIDRFPRLHTFSGSKECLKGMADAMQCPAIGFLSADDNRQSYYLNEKQNEEIYNQGKILYDRENKLFFKATDLRLDWFDKFFTGTYFYEKPKKSSPYRELNYRYGDIKEETNVLYTVFTHEWQIYKGASMTLRRKWIEDVCRFAKKQKWSFCFPMDVDVLNGIEGIKSGK